MKLILKALGVLGILLFLQCCSTLEKHKPAKGSITVMTYNVENLFDTVDDPKKNDETFLPRSKKTSAAHKSKCRGLRKDHWKEQCLNDNWDQDKLDRKMSRLAEVILQVKGGKGAEILMLQEVENKAVLEQFRKKYLKTAGYKEAILIEGPDKRGIDTAILTKLNQIEPAKLHEVNFTVGEGITKEGIHPTRGILQARLELPGGQPITVFSLHLPSQGSPTPMRRFVIKKLNELQKKVPVGDLILAGGDFNIAGDEEPREKLYSKDLASQWEISHMIGCDDCQGTNYYHTKKQWSFLDALLFSKSLVEGSSGWKVNTSSIRIPAESKYQTNSWGNPSRFGSGRGKTGVSDHWPVAADLVPVKATSKK